MSMASSRNRGRGSLSLADARVARAAIARTCPSASPFLHDARSNVDHNRPTVSRTGSNGPTPAASVLRAPTRFDACSFTNTMPGEAPSRVRKNATRGARSRDAEQCLALTGAATRTI